MFQEKDNDFQALPLLLSLLSIFFFITVSLTYADPTTEPLNKRCQINFLF